jgi:hypothetical protein
MQRFITAQINYFTGDYCGMSMWMGFVSMKK